MNHWRWYDAAAEYIIILPFDIILIKGLSSRFLDFHFSLQLSLVLCRWPFKRNNNNNESIDYFIAKS